MDCNSNYVTNHAALKACEILFTLHDMPKCSIMCDLCVIVAT